jgi:aminoglycoside 6'-N-acetyltransferase
VDLRGDRLTMRPRTPADARRLWEIHCQPSVERWWGSHTLAEIEQEIADEAGGGGDEVSFTIEVEGEVAGMIQYVELGDEDFRHAGIDLFLADAFQGRGLGREAIEVLVAYLTGPVGHHRLVIDPAVANERAVRCYEAVGFRPVGVMHRYQRMADGHWTDGLLMELVLE